MNLTLTASDGQKLGAYHAAPEGPARGGVVVLQEIFGVNSHIRSVCDRFAAEGYAAVAPALFDRMEPDFQSGYSQEEIASARRFLQDIDWEAMLRDTEAAIDHLAAAGHRVATVGFCLGGSVSYLAATRRADLVGAVCYYGGQIIRLVDSAPVVPTIMHFGENDHSIPMSDVETIRSRHPELEVHTYAAGHGFHCDERGSFEPESAALAWRRTLDFLNPKFA